MNTVKHVDAFIKESVNVEALSGQLFRSYECGEVSEEYLREQSEAMRGEKPLADYRKAINKVLSRIEKSRSHPKK